MRRKKALFLSFLLCNLVAFGEKTIQLPESNIQSDYIEINKMKNTKHIIVIEKKDIEEKGYTNFSSILQDIPSIHVGTLIYGDKGKEMQEKTYKF